MIILRRIYRDPPWDITNERVDSAVFQLFKLDDIYVWIRADLDLQDEDVPILELDNHFLRAVWYSIPNAYNTIKPGRYIFLAKEEHFEQFH